MTTSDDREWLVQVRKIAIEHRDHFLRRAAVYAEFIGDVNEKIARLDDGRVDEPRETE